MMVGRLNKKKTKFTSPVKRHLWDGKGMGCLELVMFCLPAGPTGVIGLEKVNDTMQLGFVHLCISQQLDKKKKRKEKKVYPTWKGRNITEDRRILYIGNPKE